MISQAELEVELQHILDKIRHIPPSDLRRGQDPFHHGKSEAAEHVLQLLGRVRGVATPELRKPYPTAAEIRHRLR